MIEVDRLEIEVTGIKLKNPIIFGAAGYSYDAWGMKRLLRAGFAAVVTKTTTAKKFEGAPMPRVFFFDEDKMFMDGTEALINPGIEKMVKHVKEAKKLADKEGAYIIGSCAGRSPEEFAELAQRFEDAGVVALEADLTCPSGWSYRSKQYPGEGWEKLGVCNDPKRAPTYASKVIRAVKETVDIPFWPKVIQTPLYVLTPGLIETIDKAGPDAYKIMGPRPPRLFIDIEKGKPMRAGADGICEKPATIRFTADIARITKTPLVPSGGLRKGRDVIEAFMVGASAVEICSGVYVDIEVVKKALKEIEQFMWRYCYTSLEEIKGMALKHLPRTPDLSSYRWEVSQPTFEEI